MKLLFLIPLFWLTACTFNQQNNKGYNSTDERPKLFQPLPDLTIHKSPKTNEIDNFFYDLYFKKGFNGCVLVAQEGRVIYKKAWGYFNREKKENLKVNSVFQLASVSKQFTAVAVLQLVKEGKLKLDQDVKELIAGFPYDDITVKQLLCHRSGLPDYRYFCDVEYKEKSKVISNQQAIDLMIKCKPGLYYKANKHFDYNNTNYLLLASIIEKVSGLSYNDYLKTHIFEPLQMKNTFIYAKADVPKNVAIGYSAGAKRVYNDYQNGVVGDKNIFSTVEDLFIWDQGLYNGTILDSTSLSLAYQPYSPEMKTRNYGFGFRLKRLPNGDPIVFHGGWWRGYNSLFYRRLRDKTAIIILSNRANFCFNDMTKVWNILDGTNNKDLNSQDQDI